MSALASSVQCSRKRDSKPRGSRDYKHRRSLVSEVTRNTNPRRSLAKTSTKLRASQMLNSKPLEPRSIVFLYMMVALAPIQGVAASRRPRIPARILDGTVVEVRLFKHKIENAIGALIGTIITGTNKGKKPSTDNVARFMTEMTENYKRYFAKHGISGVEPFHPGFFFKVRTTDGEEVNVMMDLQKWGDCKICIQDPTTIICDGAREFANTFTSDNLRKDFTLREICDAWCGKGKDKQHWIALCYPGWSNFDIQHTCQDFGLAVLRWLLKEDLSSKYKLGNIRCNRKTTNIREYVQNLNTFVGMCTEVSWDRLYADVLGIKTALSKKKQSKL